MPTPELYQQRILSFEEFLESCGSWYKLLGLIWGRNRHLWRLGAADLARIARAVHRAGEKLHSKLEQVDFSQVDDAELLLLYQHAGISHAGPKIVSDMTRVLAEYSPEAATTIRRILGSSELSQLDTIQAGIFLLDTLCKNILLCQHRGTVDSAIELWWSWALSFQLDRPTARELKERLTQRQLPIVVFSFLRKFENTADSPGFLNDKISNNLEHISKLIPGRKNLLDILRDRRHNYDGNLATLNPSSELKSQAAQTLTEELPSDPFTVLGEGLHKKLLGMPKAIKHDILDELRRMKRWEKGEIVLTESESHSSEDDIPDEPAVLSQRAYETWQDEEKVANVRELKRERVARILQAAATDPNFLKYVELTAQGKNDTEIAKILDKDRKTLYNWKLTLRELAS